MNCTDKIINELHKDKDLYELTNDKMQNVEYLIKRFNIDDIQTAINLLSNTNKIYKAIRIHMDHLLSTGKVTIFSKDMISSSYDALRYYYAIDDDDCIEFINFIIKNKPNMYKLSYKPMLIDQMNLFIEHQNTIKRKQLTIDKINAIQNKDKNSYEKIIELSVTSIDEYEKKYIKESKYNIVACLNSMPYHYSECKNDKFKLLEFKNETQAYINILKNKHKNELSQIELSKLETTELILKTL